MEIRRTLPGLVLLAAAVAVAGPAPAQTVDVLADRCAAAGAPLARCTELAVTARALQGHVGLLAGLGSEVSGSASTLGRRLGATPRVAVGARAAFAPVAVPDLADTGPGPSREVTFVVPAVHAGVAVGAFDGFSPLPTVGGLLSLDLLAQTSVMFLPTGEGFDGKASSYTVGVRVGLLRESFTLPGVSVSVSRRDVGRVRLGSVQEPGRGAVEVDPVVTSVRATVGKDLLSVGVLAGVGWDRYGGTVTLSTDGGSAALRATGEAFDHTRTVAFGGAAMNFLILQLSAEAGWARGFDGVTRYATAPFDPTRGTLYGSLAFRLTL